MSVVYIISEHGKLSCTNETLEFTSPDGTVRKMFPHRTDSLIISGVVSISGAAMRLLMKYQINTLFISSNGRFNGKLVFTSTKNILLRKKQYAISDDEQRALPLAKSIVIAKIKNELTFVQRIKRKTNSSAACATTIQALKIALDRAEQVRTLDELRGYEGIAAKNYFSVFRYNLIPDWAEFPSRSKNPPQTNVNATLSFLYTLLMYRVETAIETAGLDPMAGFLHASDYGKNALTFDLMEEFRTPFVDTICCSLFNLNTLTAQDFEQKATVDIKDALFDPNEGEAPAEKIVLLTRDGLKKVIPAFEKKMENRVQYQGLDNTVSLNTIIMEQVKHLKRVLLGEEKEYKGFLYR